MPEETSTARRPEDIALDLMKFVAMTTGYGKPVGGAGFQAKPEKSTEDYAESLMQLYLRCKEVVKKP